MAHGEPIYKAPWLGLVLGVAPGMGGGFSSANVVTWINYNRVGLSKLIKVEIGLNTN